MKELSVEEKAKRYDEILARATGAYLPYYTDDIMSKVKEFVDYLLPELKESEDLRIIKAIKYGIDHVFTNNTTVFEVTKEQCLAWLEKKSEKGVNWDDMEIPNTWKPSKEQIEALEHSLGDYNIKIFEDRYEILKSLYNDLKKLKGEKV